MDHWNDICIFSPQCNEQKHVGFFSIFFFSAVVVVETICFSQVEKWMEKLEESEPKRRRTIKTFIVAVSVTVSWIVLRMTEIDIP